MKSATLALSISATSLASFVLAYFYHLTMGNAEQYTALIAVVFVDGFFGIIAGTKRYGFQTCKALKVLQTAVVWVILLTTILVIERGFSAASWLSETILIPFIVFQLISALKNASMAGFIKAGLLNDILDRIDKHKGDRI
jgi:phage-related holin